MLSIAQRAPSPRPHARPDSTRTLEAPAQSDARLRRTHELERRGREGHAVERLVVFFGEVVFDVGADFDFGHVAQQLRA